MNWRSVIDIGEGLKHRVQFELGTQIAERGRVRGGAIGLMQIHYCCHNVLLGRR
jgi:hypothetical protein